MPADVVDLFRKHFLHEHVNVRAVINELNAQKENPVSAFHKLLDDAEAADWHFYATEGLRSLAAQGRLDPAEGRKLLDATRALSQQFGVDEYYKSVTALAASPSTAPFADRARGAKAATAGVRDWRWLAFVAAGTLLQQVPKVLTQHLAEELQREAAVEPDPRRRPQMQDVAARCLSVTKE
jgi:hypothetical protein